MEAIIVKVVVALWDRLQAWIESPEGQAALKRMFKALRKAFAEST